MLRPKRTAAERARSLIAKGFNLDLHESTDDGYLSPDEEDNLELSLNGIDEIIAGLSGVDGQHEAQAGGNVMTFSSYRDKDITPDVSAFTPFRDVGPHIPRQRAGENFYRAIDFFNLYSSDDILELICENSNTYAWLNILQKPTYAAWSDGAWTDITVPELKSFIALLILMGFYNLPDIPRYWSTAALYNGCWARRFMSRNRFKALLAFIHISNPDAEDKDDKLTKLRPLLSHMKKACKEVYQPDKSIAIDERMVKSKGRSGIRQFMPLKPVRFGYKLWCLWESSTGYTVDFNVYTGKREHPGEFGLAYDVVMQLISDYKHQGYMLYTDNFYTSVPLFKELSSCGVGACGTILQTRKQFPKELKDKQWQKDAKRGEMRYQRDEELLMIQWKDTRVVNVCSTVHSGHDYTMVKRNIKDPKGAYRPIMVKKPLAIMDYNKGMGAVDLSDQLLQPYSMLFKCHRWWKTLFLHIIDVAVVNSHIMFKEWVRRHQEDARLNRIAGFSQIGFREELVKQLGCVADDEPIPTFASPSKETCNAVYHTDHLPVYTDRRHNCKVCYINLGRENRTKWWCRHARCSVPLCLSGERNCFALWHTAQFDKYRAKVLEWSRHHSC